MMVMMMMMMVMMMMMMVLVILAWGVKRVIRFLVPWYGPQECIGERDTHRMVEIKEGEG
jgi:hypothetical protein